MTNEDVERLAKVWGVRMVDYQTELFQQALVRGEKPEAALLGMIVAGFDVFWCAVYRKLAMNRKVASDGTPKRHDEKVQKLVALEMIELIQDLLTKTDKKSKYQLVLVRKDK